MHMTPTDLPAGSPRIGRRALLVGAGATLLPRPALANEVTGAGSTFVQPILMRWGQRFTNISGEGGGNTNVDGGLDYEPSGSGAAVARLLTRGGVDFGATDVSLALEELDRLGLVQFPIVSGGISVVANLRGIATGAPRLNPAVLARILTGGITDWSDPDIAALNPRMSLRPAPIHVSYRSDGSGTTWNLAAYLAQGSPDWRVRMGTGWTLRWLAGTGHRGSAALLRHVAATPGSIGYAETGQAERSGLTAVLLPGSDGRPLAPTPAAISEALASLGWDAARQFHQDNHPPQAPGAYPLTATVFVVMRRRPNSRAGHNRTLGLFQAALTEGGPDATALGYVPLPGSLTRLVFAHWRAAWG
jgi:phosphate transport system substrate-binding protein